MSATPDQHSSFSAKAPSGFKFVAWDGVGVFVPQRWDIGRYTGGKTLGGYRIDSEHQVRVLVKWWRTRGPISLERVVEQQKKQAQQAGKKRAGKSIEVRIEPATGLRLPTEGRSTAFRIVSPDQPQGAGVNETVLVWQHHTHRRAAMWRFLDVGELIHEMLRGLTLREPAESRAFAALDFCVTAPPRYEMQKAQLNSGVSYLRFACWRSRIAYRRFSAANAVLGGDDATMDDLERWCRKVYANEFFDMRYQVEADPQRRELTLTGRRRLFILPELKSLIPRHRISPTLIRIVWDQDHNKIHCFEVRRVNDANRADIEAFMASAMTTLGRDGMLVAPLPVDRPTGRLRSLMAKVELPKGGLESDVTEQGRVTLSYLVAQPPKLRFFRVLAAQPIGTPTQRRTVELDMVGSMIWRRCADRPTVMTLIEEAMRTFQISYREAELSVSMYVKMLGQRGLLVLHMPPDNSKV